MTIEIRWKYDGKNTVSVLAETQYSVKSSKKPGNMAITPLALYEGLALLFFVDQEACQWTKQIETSVQLLLDGLQPPCSL